MLFLIHKGKFKEACRNFIAFLFNSQPYFMNSQSSFFVKLERKLKMKRNKNVIHVYSRLKGCYKKSIKKKNNLSAQYGKSQVILSLSGKHILV